MIDAISSERETIDCSIPTVFVGWFFAGALDVLCTQYFAVSQKSGDWNWLLHVGSQSLNRDLIESELGKITSDDPIGHDGQLFYLVVRDPFGANGMPDQMPSESQPRYRYRRILFPLWADAGGVMSGQMTLWNMIILTAMGAGLPTVAAADICYSLRLRRCC